MAECEVIGREHPEIEADEHRLGRAQMIHQSDQIAHRVVAIIGGGIGRRLGLAHAAHVGHDHPPARGRDHRNLVPPGKPQMREAVAQDDERAIAFLHPVHPDAVIVA